MDYVDLGPKTEDLILEAQINVPYQNFSNLPAERKRPISTLLFINLSKFWRKRKTEHDLQSENQTVQIFITPQQRIKKYNKSTQHIFYKMKKIIHNIARSKLQTSHHKKIQFEHGLQTSQQEVCLNCNSNKLTKTEHG